MPEISKIKLTSGDEYNIKDTTAREMISSHTHTNESMGFGYGTCDTAASTTDKTVSISNYKLTNGGIVCIGFTNKVPANATLNINSTGDKSIYYNGSAITDDIINAEDTATFIYDGTNNRYNLISLDKDFNKNRVLKCEGIGIKHGNEFPVYTSKNSFVINNIKYKLIIATFDSYVYCASTINCIPIYYNDYAIQDDIIYPGDTATFIYNEINNRYEIINIDTKIDNDRIIIPYAKSRCYKCDTAAATINKTISYINGYSSTYDINENYIICVKFTNDVPANATLNIYSRGAKPIYNNNAPITDGIINSGDIATFIYDGTNYNYMCKAPKLEMNVDYTIPNISSGYVYDGVCNTDANDTNKIVPPSSHKNLAGNKLGIITIKFTNAVPANSTLNSKPIYYNSAPITDDIINAGDTVKFICDGSNYHLLCSYVNISFKDINSTLNNKADSTHTHINASMGQGYALSNLTQNNNCIYAYSNNCIPAINDLFIIKFNNDVPENAMLNINDTGNYPIYCSRLLNSDREFNNIALNSGMMLSCIENINGMIKSGDIALVNYVESSNNGKFYCVMTSDSHNNENTNLYYAEINNTSADISTTIENYTLKSGYITIKFNNDVPENATLNISSTGAKPIYYNGSAITDDIINAGDIIIFNYSNNRYNLVATDNYNNENINQKYAECLNENHFYHASLNDYILSTGGIASIKFNNDVIANATLNINDTGAKSIYYKDSAITDNIIKAGDTATFIYDGTNYNLISLDRDFNPITVDSSLSTTSTNPVENNVITNALNNKADSTHTHINESMGFGFGYCYTPTSTTAKTVSMPNYKLTNGGIVSIYFQYDVTTSYGITLNISNTGALPIYYNDYVYGYSSSVIKNGDIATFICTGHEYILISLNKNFDSYTNENIGFGYFTCDTAASLINKSTDTSVSGYTLTNGGIVSVKFTYSVPANATLNITYTGDRPIFYNNAPITDGIIKAGDTATFIFTGVYNLISLDRDFNPITVDSSLSTTSNNPVQNNVITNALNNYMPTIVGTQIESTNNWTGNAQFETLEDGQRILYYLPYDNSSGSDVVLNLTLADGTTQTGNINCYLSGSTRLNSQYEAGNFIPLIYKENIAFNGSSTTYTGWWAYTDKDIDSKVQNTLNNTTKAYITGTTNNTTNIGTQIFDNNVYLGTTAGELNTKSLKLNEKVALNYNNDNNCIDFIFS